jgi:hypothetical protein
VRARRLASNTAACRVLPLHFDATPEETEAYYSQGKGVAPLEQVKFIGGKNQKSVSADFISAFLAPFRFSAGTTVTDTNSQTDTGTDR